MRKFAISRQGPSLPAFPGFRVQQKSRKQTSGEPLLTVSLWQFPCMERWASSLTKPTRSSTTIMQEHPRLLQMFSRKKIRDITHNITAALVAHDTPQLIAVQHFAQLQQPDHYAGAPTAGDFWISGTLLCQQSRDDNIDEMLPDRYCSSRSKGVAGVYREYSLQGKKD